MDKKSFFRFVASCLCVLSVFFAPINSADSYAMEISMNDLEEITYEDADVSTNEMESETDVSENDTLSFSEDSLSYAPFLMSSNEAPDGSSDMAETNTLLSKIYSVFGSDDEYIEGSVFKVTPCDYFILKLLFEIEVTLCLILGMMLVIMFRRK